MENLWSFRDTAAQSALASVLRGVASDMLMPEGIIENAAHLRSIHPEHTILLLVCTGKRLIRSASI
jgi:hypothetical protein